MQMLQKLDIFFKNVFHEVFAQQCRCEFGPGRDDWFIMHCDMTVAAGWQWTNGEEGWNMEWLTNEVMKLTHWSLVKWCH